MGEVLMKPGKPGKPPGGPPPALSYPKVMTGQETLLTALEGRSISRFGDGELRLALGGNAISQPAHIHLQSELINLLKGPTASLVCIPRMGVGPKAGRWQDYAKDKYVRMMKQDVYGSAFISRPDSEPEINTPEFWANLRSLWKNRDVTLVVGTDYGSLNQGFLRDARNLKVVYGQRVNAFAEISALEDQIGTPPHTDPVIMCLGACATVLAERLARKGCWALDLGHVGKFMPKEFR